MDQKGLVELLEKIKLPGLILLVDEEWKESRPVQTTQDILNAYKGGGNNTINIQYMDLVQSIVSPRITMARELATSFEAARGGLVIKPLNLLSISDPAEGITPPGFAKRFDLLSAICLALREGKTAEIRSKMVKKAISEKRKCGLEDCLTWALLGQAGSFTGWHVDNSAVIIWVTLKGAREFNNGEPRPLSLKH